MNRRQSLSLALASAAVLPTGCTTAQPKDAAAEPSQAGADSSVAALLLAGCVLEGSCRPSTGGTGKGNPWKEDPELGFKRLQRALAEIEKFYPLRFTVVRTG